MKLRAKSKMQIIIKRINGDQFTLEVDPSDTINVMRKKIEKQEGFIADNQRFIFKGKFIFKRSSLL